MLRKTIQWVSNIFKYTAGVLLGLTVVLDFIAVFMRYLFQNPISWCEEVSLFMFVTTLSFSIVPMTYNKRAVKLDFFTDMMKPILKFSCNVLVDFVACIALAATSVLGIELMKRTKYRVTPILNIPFRFIYLMMVIGMAVSALIYLYHMCADIKETKWKKNNNEVS